MKQIIIVGGGIAGLTAGIYARQSGFGATIFEMHNIPGGNSTSWRRGGYLFEGGMHWLVGSGPAAPLHKIWRELGALSADNPVYNRDPFLTYLGEGGPVCLYRDPNRLERHLLSLAPKDAKAIRSLAGDIRAFRGLGMPVMDVKGVRTATKTPPPLSMLFALIKASPRMRKLNRITAGDYADRFSHPGIRTLLRHVVGCDDYTASSIVFTLGGLAAGDGGYPAGGSLRMAKNMADTFTALGGAIRYRAKVQQVAVAHGRVQGVVVDGALHPADAVIVTADARAAIDTLFGRPLREPWMDELRAQIKPLACTFLGLGVRANLTSLPENPVFPLSRPLEFGGTRYESMGLNNYAAYEGYAPNGCAALTCALMGDTYDIWKAAKEDGTYRDKKRELAEQMIARLEEAVPQLAGNVEVWDMATPLTYERYCGGWRGSWMSVMSPGCKRQQYPGKSESIRGLYFAGQRLMLPGGLPVAAATGRQAVQHLCLDENAVFQGMQGEL